MKFRPSRIALLSCLPRRCLLRGCIIRSCLSFEAASFAPFEAGSFETVYSAHYAVYDSQYTACSTQQARQGPKPDPGSGPRPGSTTRCGAGAGRPASETGSGLIGIIEWASCLGAAGIRALNLIRALGSFLQCAYYRNFVCYRPPRITYWFGPCGPHRFSDPFRQVADVNTIF